MSTVAGATKGKALSFNPADRLHSFLGPTVWHTMTPLAQKHQAINLGQGFPGFSPPEFAKQALADVVMEKNGLDYMANQYARSAANLTLANTLAEKYSEALGRQVNPLNELVVCNGATGAIFNATQAFLNPGDEVIAFEPSFDIYSAQAAMCGAVFRPVPLELDASKSEDAQWGFDINAFRAAFTPQTRMLILNTPHNPTGKVFTRSELEQIAEVVRAHPNVVVVADEVYEHLIFSGAEHVRFATLPGMWDQTLTVSSAGKTFSATGWKVGWAVGPTHLIRAMEIVGSWVCFSVNTPAQIAVSRCLVEAKSEYKGFPTYFDYLCAEYTRKKDILRKGLEEVGMPAVDTQGSFFLMADTSRVSVPQAFLEEYKDKGRDWAVSCWLTSEIGVCVIPPSSFYCEENKHLAKNLVRFAFAQSDEKLHEAVKRLQKVKEFLM